MQFHCGGENELSMTDGEGVAFVLFLQGCPLACPGCHNPELQDPNGGTERYTTDTIAFIDKFRSVYDSFVVSGGEPLQQAEVTYHLLSAMARRGLKTYLYTGYEYEAIPPEIEALCDVIVAGPYRQELATGGFPASSNQTIHTKETTTCED